MNSLGSPATPKLAYLITVSRAHIHPCRMLLQTLIPKTQAEIILVGNLSKAEIKIFENLGVSYIDENDIDLGGRWPKIDWNEKYRSLGWYKQMFIRLSIDRFMNADQVVILDSEVFVFDNWDESRFFDPATGFPRCFYWIPDTRKSDWDYKMYRGAAYLLNFLPSCKGIMDYANSNDFKRHISGVVLFSTKNVKELWNILEKKTDLSKNIDHLFNHESQLAFSDHDIYGMAVEYGLFNNIVPTVMYNNLLGWYDNHTETNFNEFKQNAMWSMCQNYHKHTSTTYSAYMQTQATLLKAELPETLYWNPGDRVLIDHTYDKSLDIEYFNRYSAQLDATARVRFESIYKALQLLRKANKPDPVLVEIGTLRDSTVGGGHSTYKFGEFCSRFGGTLHTVDISSEAIAFSKSATSIFSDNINYYNMDSESFFDVFNHKIDFLYLDGFDSLPGQEQLASEKQLKEIKKAYPKLADTSIVLLDDAKLPYGGKTAYSSEYLIANGFDLIVDSYQLLYYRNLKSPVRNESESTPPSLLPSQPSGHPMSSPPPDLVNLVSQLPEIYQPIYGHPEIPGQPSRSSLDRWDEISRLHDALARLLGRPVRVLDLGCSQGFFSLSLAKAGASVAGVDFNEANIAVCKALASEHPSLRISFATDKVENVLPNMRPGEYDLVLGLSVFHHLSHEHGYPAVTQLLADCASKVLCGVFELALGTEPLYWAAAQPERPQAILDGFDFVHTVSLHDTHLSEIRRPLCFASNQIWYLDGKIEPFESCTKDSHHLVGDSNLGTRKYFFSERWVAKLFSLDREPSRADHNRAEIAAEMEFLQTHGSLIPSPRFISAGVNATEAWLVRERIPGVLLSDLISQGKDVDFDRILRDVLDQLCRLESAGLYHNDLRLWNILITSGGESRIIDFGSISSDKRDVVWPHDPFLAFWIVVHELVTQHLESPIPRRQPFISPSNLPEPYRAWGLRVWARPTDTWSFRLIRELFHDSGIEKPAGMDPSSALVWMQAIENYLQDLNRASQARPSSILAASANEGGTRLEAMLFVTQGETSEKAGRIEEALNFYIKGMEADHAFSLSFLRAARLLEHSGDLAGARSCLEAALDHDPKDSLLWDALIHLSLNHGDPGTAAKDAWDALGQLPEGGGGRWHSLIAQTLLAKNAIQDARVILARGLQAFPGHPALEELRRNLAETS